MKICWDTLEGVRLTRNGTFSKGTVIYIYKESCTVCGDSYLVEKRRQNGFCGKSCAKSGKNNVMYGKTHTIETRKRMSKPRVWSQSFKYNRYKGGISALGLAAYVTHKNTLGIYEDVRKQSNTEVLEVKCVYCGRWFAPMYDQVKRRLIAVNSLKNGECRLYCSNNCRQSCPTYGRSKYPKGFKKATSREVSTYLRKMVFERDGWGCQKCGKTVKEAPLHCHHIKGYAQNKILANDIDNCITLCKECHKSVHRLPGCSYYDLRCKSDNSFLNVNLGAGEKANVI